jgi:beta-lactamase class A
MDGAATLGCTPELCRLALNILLWQKLNTRLPFLLPGNARVSHKTGTRAPVYNDAGIVYEGDQARFILAVYANSPSAESPHPRLEPGERNLHIARQARTCWDALCG